MRNLNGAGLKKTGTRMNASLYGVENEEIWRYG